MDVNVTWHLELRGLFVAHLVESPTLAPLLRRTYAASLLLGIFPVDNCAGKGGKSVPGTFTAANYIVTRREVRAAGGIRGLYSFARR